jgi:hypothetical protein
MIFIHLKQIYKIKLNKKHKKLLNNYNLYKKWIYKWFNLIKEMVILNKKYKNLNKI